MWVGRCWGKGRINEGKEYLVIGKFRKERWAIYVFLCVLRKSYLFRDSEGFDSVMVMNFKIKIYTIFRYFRRGWCV